jgi:hypothetical protein
MQKYFIEHFCVLKPQDVHGNDGRRGLLTKATNHAGLDKSCHPRTISQSGNDSATSTRLP